MIVSPIHPPPSPADSKIASYDPAPFSLSPLSPRVLHDGEDSEWAHAILAHLRGSKMALCQTGVGGTYFVANARDQNIAVFKPASEEPGAPSNPKKLFFDPPVAPGRGAIREVAAFAFDRHIGAGVPPTCLVDNVWSSCFSSDGPQWGSVQKYIDNVGDSDAFGSGVFSVNKIHLLGILDVCVCNMDRNPENILVISDGQSPRKTYHPVPIDHSYILPSLSSLAEKSPFFAWIHWKQTKVPFSEDTLQMIEALDTDAVASLFSDMGIDSDAVSTFFVCSEILKAGARRGLTLFDIARLVSSTTSGEMAPLQNIVTSLKCNGAALDKETVLSRVLELVTM